MTQTVLVLGCGPAAAISAIELGKLGYQVQVIGELRQYTSTEGISERVYDALHQRGLGQDISEPVNRTAIWSGDSRSVNTERLVNRRSFDAQLMSVLRDSNIEVIPNRVKSVDAESLTAALLDGQVLSADFIVDARGRAAGYGGSGRVRGPESVSLCAEFQSEPNKPMTLAISQKEGWLWLARRVDGHLFAQKTTGGEPLHVRKNEIADWLANELGALPDILVRSVGDGFARSSTPVLVDDIAGPGYIRIGDAASAVDPLSGNGIFQALSSGLTAVPVINTLLKRSVDAELAMGFYRERVEHLFYRFARTGRDFYRSEARWSHETFWQDRQAWPDNEPLHVENDEVIGRAIRPVINNGFIEEKDVVITRDQPLGVWLDR